MSVNVKRFSSVIVLWVFAGGGLFAAEQGDPISSELLSQQRLKEVSVSKFEDIGFWYGDMSRDEGALTLRAFEGAPNEKEAIPGEQVAGLEESDKNVLGAKVVFIKRSVASFLIKPVRPIPIEGVVKTLSFWIVGRNTEHRLEILLHDAKGQPVVLDVGKLNFLGWRHVTIAIPPNIVQRDYHQGFAGWGLTLEGFKVSCNLDETYGKFYLYLDDLRAVTDVVGSSLKDKDDMPDSW